MIDEGAHPAHGSRTGSLPLRYAVLALIGLATAATVILMFTGNIDTVDSIIEGNIGQGRQQIIKSECLRQKNQLCSQEAYSSGDTGWADEATYDEKTCRTWHDERNIFGESGVPGC